MSYNSQTYMKLPLHDNLIDQYAEIHMNLPYIGEVVRKFGYEKLLGACLLHRHYDLHHNEILLTYQEKENLYSEPVTFLNDEVIERRWAWDEDKSKWSAYEFISKAIMSDFDLDIASLQSDEEFWDAISKVITSRGISDKIGLTLHDPRDQYVDDKHSLLELNAVEDRKTIVALVNSDGMPQNGVTVWNFYTKDSMSHLPSMKCAHGNSQHCCGNIKEVDKILAMLH